MSSDKVSGQAPFVFSQRKDLNNLPTTAQPHEVDLHGGFDIDDRDGFGQIYYGMPGCGIMRIDGDLKKQEIISLPDDLKPLNFHSTKVANFDGKTRLIMPANGDQKVAILTLDGEVDFVLPRPTFEQYQDAEAPYSPTDTVLVDDQLFIADGYGSNYISSANIKTHDWTGIFGGKTDDKTENGKFATAHGINYNPVHHLLDIADRPHSRVQTHHTHGGFIASHNKFPQGAFLCGISYLQYQDRWYAVIGCLRDPDEGRPAPIYILDAETYEVLSIIRPKEELGIDLAQHLHNVMLHVHDDQLYLICQAWNPGHYFVLQQV